MSAEDRTMTDLSANGAEQATLATAADSGSGPDPIFNPLHAAKSELGAQAQHPSHLHPLHSSAQSLYDAQGDGTHLSRDQFRQLIAQLRHSIGQFSATNPALQPPSRSDAHPTTFQNQAETVTSDAVRRYISLLTEASTHTAALARSVEPFRSTVASASRAKTSASFPTTLLAGCLAIKQAKRPSQNWDDAVEALGALSDTIEQVGRNLGLEAFVEPAQDTAAPQDADSSTLTHTLTLGAKIIVIDVEFRAVRQTSGLQPRCRLNLSYANDSESTQRDPELGLCLHRDIQAIADRLFGVDSAVQDAQSARETAIESLHHFSQNLAELAALDDLCAKANEASQPVDLFDAMQRLSAAMVSVHQAEAASASTEALLDRGHGVSVLHTSRPFLQTTFAKDTVSGIDYNLFLDIKPLSLTPADKTESSAVPTLSSEAAKAVQLANLPEQLGSISGGAKSVPLYFVVRLNPPVIVTRPTAAKLAAVGQLRQLSPANALAPAATQLPESPWFEDILSQSWSQRPVELPLLESSRFTFTLARTVDSLRDPSSQGLVIDSVPLLTRANGGSAADASHASVLTRLLTVIEILRDEVKLTELTRSAVASSAPAAKAAETAAEPTLDELLAGTSSGSSRVPVTLSFRFPSSAADAAKLDSLVLELAFQVATKESPPRHASFVGVLSTAARGWTVGADIRLPGIAGEQQVVKLEHSSPDAQAIAAELTGSNALESVVSALLAWAETKLDVHFDVPTAETATFDPLAYEQANVHAVYETIAPHFSSTRYKPWPLIPAFLDTIPPGSVGADLGCGNGKYLPLRSTLATPAGESGADSLQNSLLTVGVDRSSNLVHLARDNFGMADAQTKSQPEAEQTRRRQEVAVGDAIQSSLRTGVFDYAISIATIHHFSTWERRRAAVHELIRIVAPVSPPSFESAPSAGADPRMGAGHGRGRFMIFVWALEQKMEGKRQFEAQDPEALKQDRTIKDPNNDKAADRLVSYSGLTVAEKRQQREQELQEQQLAQAHVTDDQDVLVPWVLASTQRPKSDKVKGRGKNTRKGSSVPAEQDLESAVSDLTLKSDAASSAAPVQETPVYNRYYHVFRSGELESLVADAAATMPAVHRRSRSAHAEAVGVVCEASGWERGNWWGVWRVQWHQS